MGSLKILIVSERYWPDGSGGELATHLVVNVLSRKFDVTVITGTRNPSKLPRIEYIYEPLLSREKKLLLWYNLLKLVRTERFKKLVSEADVIYVPRISYPIIPFAKEFGKKVVVHLHSYAPISYTAAILAPYEKHKGRITRDDILLVCMKGAKYCPRILLLWWLPKLARKWILHADKVICVSKRQARIIADLVPELRDKIEVVHNMPPPDLVSSEPEKKPDNTPTFLYVGGDSHIKGFNILLQALNQLGKRGVRARFIFTNKYSPQGLKKLRQLSMKYRGLEIEVKGRIEYEKLLELYRRAWALVFPSIWEEPLPYAVVEASVSGIIPVASRVGGVVELLDDTIASKYMFMPDMYMELTEKLVNVSSLTLDEVEALSLKLRREILVKLNPSKIEEKLIQVFSE